MKKEAQVQVMNETKDIYQVRRNETKDIYQVRRLYLNLSFMVKGSGTIHPDSGIDIESRQVKSITRLSDGDYVVEFQGETHLIPKTNVRSAVLV